MSTSENKAEEMTVRLLINDRQVGSIIGKRGVRIQEIRETVGIPFLMNILKSESRVVEERILVCKGTVKKIAKAVQLTGMSIFLGSAGNNKPKADSIEVEYENMKAENMKSEDNMKMCMCILVQKYVIGSIIGRAGAMIQGIQSDTNTRIQISSDPLPNSTEKTVTVTGLPKDIHDAVFTILTQLEANPLRPGTKTELYRPGVPGAYGEQVPYSTPSFMGAANQPLYGMPSSSYGLSSQERNSTQKIIIPTSCAGSVIGRGGNVIRRLNAQTGCTISILDAEQNNPDERVAVITGTSQGIQSAIYGIRQLVDQYQPTPLPTPFG